MSDTPTSAHPGSITTRNVDTVLYSVIKALPRPGLYDVGAKIRAWPQGEVWACVNIHGLGVIRNAELDEWEAAGLIVRERPEHAAAGIAPVARSAQRARAAGASKARGEKTA